MLALRVTKSDPHEGHNHAKPKKEKRVKGLWTVKIEPQQEFDPMMHYVWLYEPPQWKTYIWGGLLLVAIFTVVLFPLWPLFMRQGVWYLSVGAMGLLAAFFLMAIIRLIIFIITYFTLPRAFWLYPNLFEDVGFFDSFRPWYAWHEDKKKSKKKRKMDADASGTNADALPAANGTAVATGTEADGVVARRHAAPTVEEGEDD